MKSSCKKITEIILVLSMIVASQESFSQSVKELKKASSAEERLALIFTDTANWHVVINHALRPDAVLIAFDEMAPVKVNGRNLFISLGENMIDLSLDYNSIAFMGEVVLSVDGEFLRFEGDFFPVKNNSFVWRFRPHSDTDPWHLKKLYRIEFHHKSYHPE